MVSIKFAFCCVLLIQIALATAANTTKTPGSTMQGKVTTPGTTDNSKLKLSTPKSTSDNVTSHQVHNVSEEVTGNTTGGSTEVDKITATTENVNDTTENVNGTSENVTVTSDGAKTTTQMPTTRKPIYPSGDPRNCDNFKNLLTVLPGNGWDNLVSKLTKRNVLFFNYSHCRTTNDGKYLIPDEISEISLNPDSATVETTVITDFKKYVSIGVGEMKKQYGLATFSDIEGSFSSNFEFTKKKMVQDNAVVVRVQYPKSTYLISVPTAQYTLDNNFKLDLINISDYVVNGNIELANYYADVLIKHYGTHFTTKVTAGGLLATEDVVRKAYANIKNDKELKKLEEVAKNTFEKHFELKVNFSKSDLKTMEEYKRARTASNDTILGGNQNETKFDYSQWSEEMKEEQAAIEVEGDLLHEIITTSQLQELPPPLVERLRNTVRDAVMRYYRYNVHSGCTDPTAKNFVFAANHDDHSCNAPTPQKFTFGGVYQTCKSSDDHKYCKEYEAKNPVTKDFSCPKEFIAVSLRFKMLEKTVPSDKLKKCIWKCSENEIRCKFQCIPDGDQRISIEYKTYWCVEESKKTKTSGVAFGGLYTSKFNNSNTGDKKCPTDFDTVKIDKDIHVCVGKPNHKSDVDVPFGGFFSCAVGNPLAASDEDFMLDLFWPKACPQGFTRQIANIDEQCAIQYCTVRDQKKNYKFAPLVVPASGNPPHEDEPDTTTVVVFDDATTTIYYRTDSHGPWKKAHSKEELKEAGLEGLYYLIAPKPSTTTISPNSTKSTTDDPNAAKQTNDDSKSNGWTIAVAVITVAAVVAALGIGFYIYTKKRNAKSQTDGASIVENDESQNQMEEQRSSSYDQPPTTISGEHTA